MGNRQKKEKTDGRGYQKFYFFFVHNLTANRVKHFSEFQKTGKPRLSGLPTTKVAAPDCSARGQTV